MDNIGSNRYNNLKSIRGVIRLVPVAKPLKHEVKQSHSTRKTAMEIRKNYGVRTSSGKRLVELCKEGK
ncbi:hypothetical protein [Niallia sp. 01092]|uniref:hypothetical protein n=1 Tax=unclassified Niallia TaxID=2837522 RepID=UPI003FD30B15